MKILIYGPCFLTALRAGGIDGGWGGRYAKKYAKDPPPLHWQPSRMLLLLIPGYVASAWGRPRGPHIEEQTAARAGSQVLIQAHWPMGHFTTLTHSTETEKAKNNGWGWGGARQGGKGSTNSTGKDWTDQAEQHGAPQESQVLKWIMFHWMSESSLVQK